MAAVESKDKLLTLGQYGSGLTSFAGKVDARFLKLTDAGALAKKDKVALADLDTDATAKVTALDTLIGSDTDKSARTIANEELAKQLIPENAQESLDTLQEIAAWIQDHPSEAAALNVKLTLGTYDDGGEQKQYASVKEYVEAYVQAQQAASALGSGNGISVADQKIAVAIDETNANGLSVGENGVALAEASADAAGAMSAADKTKLDGIVIAEDSEVTEIIAGIWKEEA